MFLSWVLVREHHVGPSTVFCRAAKLTSKTRHGTPFHCVSFMRSEDSHNHRPSFKSGVDNGGD
jgi:hypothetical protein